MINHNDYTEKTIQVNEVYAGWRIDQVISDCSESHSRSFIQKLIAANAISLNKKIIQKSSMRVKEGDLIAIAIPSYETAPVKVSLPMNLVIDIIFEDEHFVIISKPAGLVVHPPRDKYQEATLVQWITALYPNLSTLGNAQKSVLIHRLDKDTSGLMIIPRTQYAYNQFGTLFHDRLIEKTYYAIVQGTPDPLGSINKYIGRDRYIRTKMAAYDGTSALFYKEKGHTIRPAFTSYKVITFFENHALLELKPTTGRTHQLRVHLASIRHPIVGDVVYNPLKSSLIERQALHAARLSFHFNGQDYTFSCPLPTDMKQVLSILPPCKSQSESIFI